MNEIKAWLAAQGDYESGLLLFMKHSRSRAKITYLQRKSDAVKLRYELEKLAGIASHKVIAVVSTKLEPQDADVAAAYHFQNQHERLSIIFQGRVKHQQVPGELLILYDEICDRYSVMRSAHEKMKIAPDDTTRAQHLSELLKLEESNREGWRVIDRWSATGELPTAKPPLDPEALPTTKEVTAARTSITRNLHLLQDCTDQPKREALLHKLQVSMAIVSAAGCGFGKNAELLESLGLLYAPIV